LIFAVEEERFTRHKHSEGEPPLNSLKEAFKFLKKQGVKPKDVDAYAVNYDPSLFSAKDRRFWAYLNSLISMASHGALDSEEGLITYALDLVKGDYMKLAIQLIRKAIIDINEEVPSEIKIYPVRHHLAHAASAYYFSGFNSATVLTIDGSGEYESTVVWKVKDGNFEPVLSMYASYASLGFLYEKITQGIKLGRLEGPGKGMGLAPYGKRSHYYDKLKEFVKITPEGDEPYVILNDGKAIKSKDLVKILSVYYDQQLWES
jgi:carbamoyltransferase